MNTDLSIDDNASKQVAKLPLPAPVLLFGLVACVIALFLPVTDIGLADETSYLMQGVHFFKALPLIDMSPLYSFWYFVLSLFVPSHYYLYFTSWCLLVFLAITIPYFVENTRASVVYGLLACLMPFYILWSYVNMFGAVIVLVTLSVLETRSKKSYVFVFFALLLTCAIITFVRPEYEYACYPAAALLAGAYYLEPKSTKSTVALIFGIAVFIAVVWLFSKFSASRSGLAFGLYNDVIAQAQGKLHENPWTSGYSYKLFGLPESATLIDFLRANPSEFLSHVIYNITRPLFIGLVLLFIFTIAISCVRFVAPSRLVLTPMPLYRFIAVALFYMPAIAATGVIFPSTHYLVIPYLVSVFYISRSDIFVTLNQSRKTLWLLILLVAGSLVLNFVVKYEKFNLYQIAPKIECLLQLQDQRGITSGNVLESMGGINAYLKGDIRRVDYTAIKEHESLPAFLLRVDPVFILTDENFFTHMAVHGHMSARSPSEMNELIRRNGYNEYLCPHAGPTIFYKN
jgi:hypothetical protein